MQVIEKVKVVPEGYNGAGMDGYGRRDVNGNTIAKDGKIDIEGIVDEEIEIIKSIPNFDFNIPVLGNGNISNGNITLSIPFINKGIMFNQSDLETFRQLLTK